MNSNRDFVVRPAQREDLRAVEGLLTSAEMPIEGVAELFSLGYAVAEADGRPVGVAGIEVHGDHGLLRSVATDAAWRGRGVGDALVRDRLEFARSRGLRGLFLLTTTAAAYFERFGFQPTARDQVPAEVRRSVEFNGVCPDSCDVMSLLLEDGDLRERIRARYAEAALRVKSAGASCGCGPKVTTSSCCGGDQAVPAGNPISSGLYLRVQQMELPEQAVAASLGCGNPTALAQLEPGQVVLDLGAGGGIDVLLAARRVGPEGKAYGLDMTDEMLELARENQRKAGIENAWFLKGQIESIPLPSRSVDVVISNCVLNLSVDKPRALAEAFRVLKPGGRFAVSDIVVRGPVPEAVRRSVELWIGCVAGALEEAEYRRLLEEAGFVEVGIEPTRVFGAEDARGFLKGAGPEVARVAEEVKERFMSAFVRARKP